MRKYLILILLFNVFFVEAQEEPRLHVGNSVSLSIPAGTFADRYSSGFGFSMNLEYTLGKATALGEFGWSNWFNSLTPATSGINDAWIISAGLRYPSVNSWYFETRTGYYFKNPDRWVLIPATGLRFQRIDINLGFSILESSQFGVARIAYFWGD